MIWNKAGKGHFPYGVEQRPAFLMPGALGVFQGVLAAGVLELENGACCPDVPPMHLGQARPRGGASLGSRRFGLWRVSKCSAGRCSTARAAAPAPANRPRRATGVCAAQRSAGLHNGRRTRPKPLPAFRRSSTLAACGRVWPALDISRRYSLYRRAWRDVLGAEHGSSSAAPHPARAYRVWCSACAPVKYRPEGPRSTAQSTRRLLLRATNVVLPRTHRIHRK
jgi:hypothetical protein